MSILPQTARKETEKPPVSGKIEDLPEKLPETQGATFVVFGCELEKGFYPAASGCQYSWR